MIPGSGSRSESVWFLPRKEFDRMRPGLFSFQERMGNMPPEESARIRTALSEALAKAKATRVDVRDRTWETIRDRHPDAVWAMGRTALTPNEVSALSKALFKPEEARFYDTLRHAANEGRGAVIL